MFKVINLNINGNENGKRFQANIGLEITDSLYDILLTETAAQSRRAAEFNAASHEIEMLKLKINKMKLLKELRELESK